MTRKASPSPPEYEIWLRGEVHKARSRLPANVRHRVRDLIDDLARNPEPPRSRELRLPEATPNVIREQWQVRRVALEGWRVVYAVSETWKEIGILLVAKRPPYNYEDLEALLDDLARH